MIKGIIFDFDGLIVDTETVWYVAFKETLFDRHAVELGLAGYANCIGTGNDVLYKYFRELAGQSVDCEQLERDAYIKYKDKMKVPVLREGVKEYLEEAKSHNLIIGLASSSSKEWVTAYLEQLHIIEYFDVINTRDDVTKVKPDPELYLKTLKDCGLLPKEAIAFEDSLNGLTAAKKAGIRCVIVPNEVTSNLPFTNHDYHLNSMKQETLEEVMKKVELIG
ncbi:HAD family hydrolase [Psychrobacillus sp. FJAT-51614]|uniref:HAD family hydrolase n=1 Tax=Psychrobacillus mangrovi TaxID=3117745 RepID=A0ABU8F745_9BACI